MARHRLRLAAQIVGWVLLSVIGLVSAVVLAVLIVGRTDWGRQKMLSTLMPVIQRSLLGELRIGKLEGDLAHMLALRDVTLLDAEGQPAVRARRVAVSYNLLALVYKTLHLTALDAEGVWIHARYLKDGRINLAALTKPSEKKGPPPDLTVRLGDVQVDAEAIYDAPKVVREGPKAAVRAAAEAPESAKAQAPKEVVKEAARKGKEEAEARVDAEDAQGATMRVHLRLRARASAKIGLKTDDIDATLAELGIETLEPARVTVSGKGGYQQRGQEMLVSGLELAVRTDGDSINRLAPAAELRGPYAVDLKADGPLSALRFDLGLRPPAGALTVRGQIGATQEKLPWEVALQARGIDPHAMRPDLPAGRIQLDASGKGEGPRGAVELKELLAEVLGARLRASGRGDLSGEGEAKIDLDAKDLGRFSHLAGTPLGGDLSLSAEASRERGHVRVRADARGDGLRAGEARIGALTLKAHTVDLTGKVQLDARAIQSGELRVSTLALTAAGSRDALSLDVTGQGPQETVLRLSARGDVLYDKDDPAHKKPTGVDATIQQLVLARAGQRWQTTGPARVRVDPAVHVAGFALASGDQRLTLQEARFDPQSKALLLRLNAKSLDAARIAQMVPAKGGNVPRTQIDLDVGARGTARAPIADVKLDGKSAALPILGLPALVYKLQAHYERERARGEVAVDTRAAKDTIKLAARFDVPVRPAGELSADVDAKLPLEQLHKVMPPGLEGLRGAAQLNLRASGSLRRPEVAMNLRVPQWSAATLQGRDTALTVNYRGERLTVQAGAGVSTTEGKRVGAFGLDASAPLRLGMGVTAAEMRRALPNTPVSGRLTLQKVDLGQLARSILASQPPVTAGQLDATMDIGGTVYDPTVRLAVDGRGVATPTIDQVNLGLRLDYEKGAARMDLQTGLRGAPILSANAGLELPVRRVLQEKGPFWRTLPLRADVKVIPYDVRRLSKNAAGMIAGSVQVRGTVAKPLVDVQLGGEGVAFQQWRVGSVAVRGAYDGVRGTAQVRAAEPTGGQLSVDAALPLDAAQPIRVDLVSKGYRLDYEPRETPKGALRVLRGLLDADLHVDGPRAQPRPYGSFHLRDGAIAVAADPRVYRKVEVDLNMTKEGLIDLRKIYATAEVGWVQVNGSVKLKGLSPERGKLLVQAERFPISAGTMALWLDAKVTASGETRGSVFQGNVTVDSGTVRLPKIASGGKKLQSTKPLEDVDYVDLRGLREATKRAEQATKQEQKQKEAPPPLDQLPTRAVIELAVPGPLYVRGKEVNAEAEGQLRMELRGPLALISGTVRVTSGWVDLLGRRWNIDKAVVSLDGSPEPNPLLNVSITRKMGDAMIYVEVHGSAERPRIVMRSDPPIYSESQIIAMIISGDPNNQRASNQSLDQKAIGAISGLVVGQIKDKLGEALPIDVLKVDVGGEGYNVFGSTRVEVGKYLTDDLYVSYTHQFGTPSGTRRMNSNQVELEYQFLRNFALETLFGDAGVGALDFYWTKRF